jgi:hypothetical protein
MRNHCQNAFPLTDLASGVSSACGVEILKITLPQRIKNCERAKIPNLRDRRGKVKKIQLIFKMSVAMQ